MTDFATLGFKADTSGLKKAQREMQGVAQQGRATEKSVETLNNGFSRMRSTVALATGVLASLGAGFSVIAAVRAADEFALLEGRIKNATQATGDFEQVMARLVDVSNQTGTSIASNVELFDRVRIGAQELGRSNSEVLDLATAVNQLAQTSGASADAIGNATLQLSQGLSGGVLRAEEFNSIVENTPAIAQAIAEGLNTSMGGLRAMVLEGRLLADDVFDSLLSQSDKIERNFEQLPVTMSRASVVLGNSVMTASAAIDEATGATSAIAQAMVSAAEGANAFAEGLAAGEYDTHLEVIKFIGTAAIAGGAAFAAYRAAVISVTAAQLAFNVAARANPVGLAVAGVGLLAAAMIHVSQSAKRSADELDRVSAKAREYRALVDTIGTAERAQRVESLKSEIERLERMNDVNFLLEQRATHFERARELEKQGHADNAAAHKRIVADLNERIANTGNLSERISEMRKELAELTGEQDNNTESSTENTQAVAAAAAEADKMIERLEREVALYGMTNEQQMRYNILLAGGTDAQAERAIAMQAWIEKQDEAASATKRLNDITQQQRDLQMQNMGAMAQEVMRHSQTLQTIEQLRADDKISHEEYLRAKHEAELAHAAQVKKIEQDLAAARAESMKGSVAAMGQAFGNMAEVAKAGGRDQFNTWKAMATAQALVSTSLAMVNALTAGPIMGPILAGTIGAMGAVQVAQIQAQEFQGSYLGGGYTGSGSRTGGLDGSGGFPAILHPNETVIDHTKGQGMGGTVVSVTPVFNMQGGGDDVRGQIMQALPMITQSVLSAVERAAGRGGSMSRAVGRR